jgi:hypothetical protein
MRYKIITEELYKNLIEFLDEIQLDAAGNGNVDDMHKVNFCTWAITELINSYEAYGKDKPKKKSRDEYVEETFMDWNLPDMSEEDFEKLVDQFDGFLRAWEKEYNKDNPKKKIKRKPKFDRPHIDDVSQYMSLEEIKEYLLDDPELTDEDRFNLYYDEHKRVQREKERKSAKSLDSILKKLKIKRPPEKN